MAGKLLPDCNGSGSDTSGSSHSEYSDWTADNSEKPWTAIATKRSKKRFSDSDLVNGDLNLIAPEVLRPSDLKTPVLPCRTPYYPQMGDQVIYFRQGLFTHFVS